MRLVDTHCHINFPDLFPDPEAAIHEAAREGVDRLVAIGCDGPTSINAIRLAERFESVFAVAGWHPNSANDFDDASIPFLRGAIEKKQIVAIGEIGLDYHWDFATKETQQHVFMAQHALAHETDMPIVLHCREAYSDLLDVLEKLPRVSMVFHCFAGTADDARRAMAMDAYFGFDGPITYKNAQATRDIIPSIPWDRLLIETDAPYLTPVPHRGKPNKPAYVSLVNSALASILGLTQEACADLTTANAERFYRLNA